MKSEEKRAKQRVLRPIPVKIKEKDRTFTTETIDISPSGAYCRTAYPLPLLSSVAITLIVSGSIKGKKVRKIIDCKGTVVRTHPVIADGKTLGYDVAIFFHELEENDRTLISEYINQLSNKEETG